MKVQKSVGFWRITNIIQRSVYSKGEIFLVKQESTLVKKLGNLFSVDFFNQQIIDNIFFYNFFWYFLLKKNNKFYRPKTITV